MGRDFARKTWEWIRISGGFLVEKKGVDMGFESG